MSMHELPAPLNKIAKSEQLHHRLSPGDTLFTQNSDTKGLFYLVSGTIDLRRTTSSGHSVIIHRARAHDTFAEASLFSSAYHCTATAATEAYVLECRRKSILSLLDTDPDFLRSMASRFSVQIQDARRRVELLAIKAADERILVALKDDLLVEDISTFAETIALAPETVYRALAQMTKDKKIVKTARGQYELRKDEN